MKRVKRERDDISEVLIELEDDEYIPQDELTLHKSKDYCRDWKSKERSTPRIHEMLLCFLRNKN